MEGSYAIHEAHRIGDQRPGVSLTSKFFLPSDPLDSSDVPPFYRVEGAQALGGEGRGQEGRGRLWEGERRIKMHVK